MTGRGQSAFEAQSFRRSYVLKNGLSVTIRAVRADDRARVRRAFEGLEPDTIYRRFHGPKKILTEADLDRVVGVDFHDAVSLLATMVSGGEEVVIGGAQYIGLKEPRNHAEVAFTIEEDFQNIGLATLLLRDLAWIGREHGFATFEAFVLPENRPMLKVFERSGFPVSTRIEGDSIRVMVDLTEQPPASPSRGSKTTRAR